MRGGRIDESRRVRGCVRSTRSKLSIARGAAGGTGLTCIVSSMPDLTLVILAASEGERAVDRQHHLEKGPCALPTTSADKEEGREEPLFKFLENTKCVSKQAKEAAVHARWGKGGLQCSRMRG